MVVFRNRKLSYRELLNLKREINLKTRASALLLTVLDPVRSSIAYISYAVVLLAEEGLRDN